jgi:hypothetical protein
MAGKGLTMFPWESNRAIARWIVNRPYGEDGRHVLFQALSLCAGEAIDLLAAHMWRPLIRGEQLFFASTLNEGEILATDFIDTEEPSDLTRAAEILLNAFKSMINLDKEKV